MNLSASKTIQEVREDFIIELDKSEDSTQRAKELANDLFTLDLTVYSKEFSFDSVLYNAFAKSALDDRISLHPEQVKILNCIIDNDASIISAPTSAGKTFCIFEYIAKFNPQNIVLIVPTLALIDEYFKKVLNEYKSIFSQYKVHTTIDEDKEYEFERKNLFILTHDRIVQESAHKKIEKIDFLVVDEVYKLERTEDEDDRVLVLNMAYYYLSKKANKYVLLAPFIKEVKDINALEKNPKFYNTSFSPVVNKVTEIPILNAKDRFPICAKILKSLNPEDKTLIYFPTVASLYKYINNVILNEDLIEIDNPRLGEFINWAKEEIHEEWCLVKALERGYLIHHGQIPIGTRMLQLDFYDTDEKYNKMLCTSTLLEGVNTTAKNIVITKPSRKSDRDNNNFSAFDFYNLVGRTGRLYKHYVGDAYYIKSPHDRSFKKADALKSVRFEITSESKDIDIQKENIESHPDVFSFLAELGITIQDYRENIGSRARFETVRQLYFRYKINKANLIKELLMIYSKNNYGRYYLVYYLYSVVENEQNRFISVLINKLLHAGRPKIRQIVNETMPYTKRDINTVISTLIRLKSSYIEHSFYNKVSIIRYFLELDKTDKNLLKTLDDRILNAIEYLYFSNIRHKKMLLERGIYERDIDNIIEIIGDDFDDAFELTKRLTLNFHRLTNISYLSRYVISSLIYSHK